MPIDEPSRAGLSSRLALAALALLLVGVGFALAHVTGTARAQRPAGRTLNLRLGDYLEAPRARWSCEYNLNRITHVPRLDCGPFGGTLFVSMTRGGLRVDRVRGSNVKTLLTAKP